MLGQPEPDMKRLAYLHEAGHAIVAHEFELAIAEVICDGEIGHCQADMSESAKARLQEIVTRPRNSTEEAIAAFQASVNVYFPRLACLLGGIAGESLVLGRPIYSTRRASDDLSNFYGFLAARSRQLPANEFAPMWIEIFQRAQDAAWGIIRRRSADVERVADALQVKPHLLGDDIEVLLR